MANPSLRGSQLFLRQNIVWVLLFKHTYKYEYFSERNRILKTPQKEVCLLPWCVRMIWTQWWLLWGKAAMRKKQKEAGPHSWAWEKVPTGKIQNPPLRTVRPHCIFACFTQTLTRSLFQNRLGSSSWDLTPSWGYWQLLVSSEASFISSVIHFFSDRATGRLPKLKSYPKQQKAWNQERLPRKEKDSIGVWGRSKMTERGLKMAKIYVWNCQEFKCKSWFYICSWDDSDLSYLAHIIRSYSIVFGMSHAIKFICSKFTVSEFGFLIKFTTVISSPQIFCL